MKKIAILIGALVMGISTLQAQQLPLYSQYMLNGFLLNPAMAGSKEYIPVCLTFRDQWEGIDRAPMTGAISGHAPLGVNKQHGVGGYIYTDIFGPITRTGFMGAYAYHLNFSEMESKLAFGLSVSAFQYVLDESNLNLIDEGDAAISGGRETAFAPDANFGVYFYNPKYFAGFTANQLIPLGISINDDNENKMVRHYFLTGGYRFSVHEKIDIEPSIMLKATEKSPVNLDINVKAYYMKNYALGFSYRTNKALVCLIGLKIDKYFMGYSFDYTFSNIRDYSWGSHEIMLGMNIGEGKSSGSTLF